MTEAESTKLSTTPMAGLASAPASGTDTNADETMRLAIARFRSRMAAANQKFLQDRINEIEARGLASEEEKRHYLRQYKYMDDLVWDEEAPERRSSSTIRIPQQTSLNDLDIPAILNALPSYAGPADGVIPPLLRTEQWRQMYLDTVQRVCQKQADAIIENEEEGDDGCWCHKDHEPMTIPRCDELALYLKYAQGVVDIDLRHLGIAPFEPASSFGVRDEELDGLDEGQRRDKLADLDLLKREQESLQQELESEESNRAVGPFIHDDLEVKAGFLTGTGYNQLSECESWRSAYVYCRLWTNDKDDGKHKDGDVQDAANIRDWGWRVVVFQDEAFDSSVLYGRKARFDSIPEFLDWYASWLDQLDARGLLSLRRHALGCETDCESECEDH
ncbi:hypothetical protein N7507_001452 [Penicillium longicatenatum]|nr:hypothetical protein N7507_001452 [Penicillium longicatenatum]